ncbi:MAG: twin-arginine translocase TatA/TatE family subunit [Acidimicrobiia bacterium]
MPSLGPAEILVILVVVLLVFGPDKMPEIGRQLARGVREFRKVQQHLSSELQGVVSELDLNPATSPEPTPGGDPPPTLPPKDTPIPDTSPSPLPDAPGSTGEAPLSPPAEPA